MGLVFTGNPPRFSGEITAEVPTPNYSGISDDNASTSINPYTGQGPGAGGAGQTFSEVADDRAGGVVNGDVAALEGKESDLLLAIGFNDTTTTPTTNTISANLLGSLTVNNTGGPDDLAAEFQGYASGWVRGADRYSIASENPSERTFVAWYKGTQSGIAGFFSDPFQPKVCIFGDESNNVAIGFGVDDGKCAVASTTFTRGTTNIIDDEWHFLSWVHRTTSVDIYVAGVKEATHPDSPFMTRDIAVVGSGFPYPGVVSPTNLDGIQIYDVAFTDQEVLDLYNQEIA